MLLGVCKFEQLANEQFFTCNFVELDVLKLNPDQQAQYLSIPPQFRAVQSCYESNDQRYYHLHQQFVEHTDEGETVALCSDCKSAINKGAVPPMSGAASVNYGYTSCAGLPELTDVESVLIAHIRLFVHIM